MALTKSDIVNELASIGKGTIFSRRQSAELVESLLEIIKHTLESVEGTLVPKRFTSQEFDSIAFR